jgi:glutamate-1-semialdehyde 2,1-aminomutase
MTAWPDPACRSRDLYERALRVMPGGTTRIIPWQPPFPVFAKSGVGAFITDVDGARYLDLINNSGSLVHGHAHPAVVKAVTEQLERGTAFTMPTESEVALAELICDRIPGIDQIRFCNSGSEAVMIALKAARAFTGRPAIAKVEGAYHGSYDYAEVSLDSSPANWGNEPASNPFSAGVPKGVLQDTIILPFNHPEEAARIIRASRDRLAGILLDVMPLSVGAIPARKEFLDAVTRAAREIGALVILDEVVSLRLDYHGGQAAFGIDPDLTTLGKIIGGGFPVGAVGGKEHVMAVFDHRKGKPPLPASGTFTANPITMTAGLATMVLLTPEAHANMDALGDRLRAGVRAVFERRNFPGQVTGMGTLFKIHMHDRPIIDYRTYYPTEAEANAMWTAQDQLLRRGYLVARGGYGFTSTPMTDADVDGFLDAFDEVIGVLAQKKVA